MRKDTQSITLAKLFLGLLIKQGIKLKSNKLASRIFIRLKLELKDNPFLAFESAINNIRPLVALQSLKKGGAIYKVPRLITNYKSYSLALHWLLKAVSDRTERTWEERIYTEILDAYHSRGTLLKKKEDLYKMAILNRPFLRNK